MSIEMTAEEEIRDVSMPRPHVVILGAGASRAAFPDGDVSGRRLPVMVDLIETLGLAPELDRFGVHHSGRNFEDVYSSIYARDEYRELLEIIEGNVAEYFSAMELPPRPTLYDYLVLSLRQKDVVATFNWDPFLYDACARNYYFAKPPRTLYLHGNVRIGYCLKDRIKTRNGERCGKCGDLVVPSKLLFPVTQKGYNQNPYIAAEWETLKVALESAYLLTIFGYSAPKTDIEAITLMRKAWGSPEERNLEQIDLLDIRSEDDVLGSWNDFIHSHHYYYGTDFYRSWLARHPRRTCEALWNQLMEVKFLSDNWVPLDRDLRELREWYRPLRDAEADTRGQP